ncbi:MAG: cobalamin B12-binding domain-containing protein [Comamonadaceae bacterium]|nr:MAG: cobalamin B12-binding domain-containing protein [Comamonadaceae bacterium]
MSTWQPIAAVERDTGLSKDTLRAWERRYGFPKPLRGAQAERSYPPEQVHKLHLLKRLLDAGHRPGRIVPLELEALQRLAAGASVEPEGENEVLQEWLALLGRHDAYALRNALAQALMQLGLERFVTTLVAPLNVAVGEAWMQGRLQVFEEHLYTECLQTVLRQAIGGLMGAARPDAPRVLLATIPQESHGLGLLLAESLFSLQGCSCLSLGVRVPLTDIVAAARSHRAQVVGLSFTASLAPVQVHDTLRELRALLPATVELWAGGHSPALRRRAVEGVRVVAQIGEIATQLSRWRAAHDAAAVARV